MTVAFRKQPLGLFLIAIGLFGILSLTPLAAMLAQFIIGIMKQPSAMGLLLIGSRQLILLGRSLGIAVGVTMVAFTLGLPTAIALSMRKLPYRNLFSMLVLIPLLVPPYVMAGAWIHLFNPTGILNKVVTSLFGSPISIYSVSGCMWCLGVSFFPIVALVVSAGLSKIDHNLQDVAKLSTNTIGVFWHSTLPQILPHILASASLVMIFALGRYGVPSLLGVNTYPVEIFTQFSAFYDETAGIAVGAPLVILVLALITIYRRFISKCSIESIEASSNNTRENIESIGKSQRSAISFLCLLFLGTTVLPFASVCISLQRFSIIGAALSSAKVDIVSSLLWAALAGIVSTSIAYPIGHYLACNHSSVRNILDMVCWLGIAIPGTILGLGVIRLTNLVPPLRNSDSLGLLMVIAYTGLFTPFAIRVLEAGFRRVDRNIDEVAAVDGAGWYRRFVSIDMPLHAPFIATSIMLVFVLSLGELNATVLLLPPGMSTMSVRIDNLLHYGANATASALCLIEAGLVIITLISGLFSWETARKLLQ